MIASPRARPERPRVGVILVGPDPDSPRGGVAVAVGGFAAALQAHGLLVDVVPTYRPGRRVRDLPGALMALRHTVRRARHAGIEPVVWAHAGGPVSMARKVAVLRRARRFGVRTLLQLHSDHTEAVLSQRSTRVLARQGLALADDLTTVAPYWQRLVAQRLRRGRVHVVSNPLPAAAERVARTPIVRRIDGPLRLLTMTHLAPGKGLELAIDGVQHGPEDAILEIAGQGPLREALEARVGELGLDRRVRFLGWVDGQAKDAAFRRADVFVLPTRNDSFGMGFIEAACYGLPGVALRYKAVPEVVLHDRTGRIVDEASPQALGVELRRLSDPAERTRLGEAARRHALDHHGQDAIVRRIRAILDHAP